MQMQFLSPIALLTLDAAFATIAWISLGIAFLCASVITIDEIFHPQRMWIMNVVWPVTALYLSVFALWGYFRIGRGMTKNAMHGMPMDQMQEYKTRERERRSDAIPPGARPQSPILTVELAA